MEERKFDYLFKIVLVGDSNVGKTYLLSRLAKDRLPQETKPTIGVEFGSKTFYFGDSVVKAQIWDTAGQERYQAITAAYYRGAFGAVIVYDITKRQSLENSTGVWLKSLREVADPNLPVMLIGNKTDLDGRRSVTREEGRHVALNEGMAFYETSALSGENVEEAFEAFIKTIYEAEKEKEKNSKAVKARREDLVEKALDKRAAEIQQGRLGSPLKKKKKPFWAWCC